MDAAPSNPGPVQRWTTVVRYAEVDQQGVVFNAHYLTYCDEALNHYCRQTGLGDLAADLQLVTTTLHWTAPLRSGEEVHVEARCVRVGRTSIAMTFDISAGDRPCCRVETVYVRIDPRSGSAVPVGDKARAALTSA